MPAPNALRAKQREEIKPLLDVLNQVFRGTTRIVIAEQSGLTNYQVGRILGEYLPAPTYLDITRLICAAAITPNEAAELVGLYDERTAQEKNEMYLSKTERRILKLLRNSRLSQSQLDLLTQAIEAIVRGLEGQVLLDASSRG